MILSKRMQIGIILLWIIAIIDIGLSMEKPLTAFFLTSPVDPILELFVCGANYSLIGSRCYPRAVVYSVSFWGVVIHRGVLPYVAPFCCPAPVR